MQTSRPNHSVDSMVSVIAYIVLPMMGPFGPPLSIMLCKPGCWSSVRPEILERTILPVFVS
jgi:hypothetical protein